MTRGLRYIFVLFSLNSFSLDNVDGLFDPIINQLSSTDYSLSGSAEDFSDESSSDSNANPSIVCLKNAEKFIKDMIGENIDKEKNNIEEVDINQIKNIIEKYHNEGNFLITCNQLIEQLFSNNLESGNLETNFKSKSIELKKQIKKISLEREYDGYYFDKNRCCISCQEPYTTNSKIGGKRVAQCLLCGYEDFEWNANIPHYTIADKLSSVTIDDEKNIKVVLEKIFESQGLISSLDLSLNNFSDTGIRTLGLSLKGIKSLTSLTLSNNGITDKGAFALSTSLLGAESCLQRFNLSHNKIGDGGAKFLLQGVKRSKALTILELEGNVINEELLKGIKEALAHNNDSKVESERENEVIGSRIVALPDQLQPSSSKIKGVNNPIPSDSEAVSEIFG